MARHTSTADKLVIEKISSGLAQLIASRQPVIIDNILDSDFLLQVEDELRSASYFLEERWLLTPSDDVELAEKDVFYKVDISRRFSHSDSLREVYRHCYPNLVALENHIKSQELTSRLSSIWGRQISSASVEVARYRKEHFLSEHADLFGNRVFALVLFLAPGWKTGNGGELIYRSDGQHHLTIEPIRNRGLLIPIRPGSTHEVKTVLSPVWQRLSIAAHFSESLE